jgi:DNA-binding MarR family transcriptional regulator
MSANSEGNGRAVGFSSPEEEALINLMRTADWLQREMQRRLKPTGLTITQYNVLRILRAARPTGLTCSAIGQRMITPEPDVTRLLTRLKSHGLVDQQRDAADRRIVWSHINPSGLKELAKLDSLVERGPRDLLGHLNREELRQLTRIIKKARSGPETTTSHSEPILL